MQLVSVVMPMRNAERFVHESLRSVFAQVGPFELEVIVVDDGSTDRSAEIVRDIKDQRIRLIPGPRRGISAAFNVGLDAARGEILARCDADDLYPPGRLDWQVRWLAEHLDVGAVCGYYSTIDDHGAHVADHHDNDPPADVTDELRNGTGRSHMCAYAFRTSIVRDIGGCREWFVTSEDADLQFRLAEVTRIFSEPRPAYLYRLHGNSITHQQISPKREFFERMARALQQQRRQTGQDDLQRGQPPAVPEFDETLAAPRHPREQIQQMLMGRSWQEHAAGRKRAALATGLRACMQRPMNLRAWRSLIALLAKRPSSSLSRYSGRGSG